MHVFYAAQTFLLLFSVTKHTLLFLCVLHTLTQKLKIVGLDSYNCVASFMTKKHWVSLKQNKKKSLSALCYWEQEQLSCHSGYTLTQYSGHHASGISLWETLRGSVQRWSRSLSLWDRTRVF